MARQRGREREERYAAEERDRSAVVGAALPDLKPIVLANLTAGDSIVNAIVELMQRTSPLETRAISFSKVISAATADKEDQRIPFASKIVSVFLHFPSGPNQLVEVRLIAITGGAVVYIVPSREDAYIALDNTFLPFNGLYIPLPEGATLRAEWYNYDGRYSHTIPINVIVSRAIAAEEEGLPAAFPRREITPAAALMAAPAAPPAVPVVPEAIAPFFPTITPPPIPIIGAPPTPTPGVPTAAPPAPPPVDPLAAAMAILPGVDPEVLKARIRGEKETAKEKQETAEKDMVKGTKEADNLTQKAISTVLGGVKEGESKETVEKKAEEAKETIQNAGEKAADSTNEALGAAGGVVDTATEELNVIEGEISDATQKMMESVDPIVTEEAQRTLERLQREKDTAERELEKGKSDVERLTVEVKKRSVETIERMENITKTVESAAVVRPLPGLVPGNLTLSRPTAKPGAVLPGQSVTIELPFLNTGPVASAIQAMVQVVGPEGRAVATLPKMTFTPTRGVPTPKKVMWTVSRTVAPGHYGVEVTVWDPKTFVAGDPSTYLIRQRFDDLVIVLPSKLVAFGEKVPEEVEIPEAAEVLPEVTTPLFTLPKVTLPAMLTGEEVARRLAQAAAGAPPEAPTPPAPPSLRAGDFSIFRNTSARPGTVKRGQTVEVTPLYLRYPEALDSLVRQNLARFSYEVLVFDPHAHVVSHTERLPLSRATGPNGERLLIPRSKVRWAVETISRYVVEGSVLGGYDVRVLLRTPLRMPAQPVVPGQPAVYLIDNTARNVFTVEA